jgi:hypothetical protein
VIHRALGRPVPVELTDDGRVRGRVMRLTTVSLVALGLVTGLGVATLEAPGAVLALLALGWVLMPTVLAWSLRDPPVRYLLVVGADGGRRRPRRNPGPLALVPGPARARGP